MKAVDRAALSAPNLDALKGRNDDARRRRRLDGGSEPAMNMPRVRSVPRVYFLV